MLISMTGFGRADAPLAGRRLVAEIRSVNHRFLELKLRVGREDGELEAELGKLVRSRLERGAVSVSLREEVDETRASSADVAHTLVDEARAQTWMIALTQLSQKLGVRETPPLALVCAQPGVIRTRASETPRVAFVEAARAATAAAVEALLDSRRREGDVLGRELGDRLATLQRLRTEVTTLADGEPARHHERLQTRVAALLEAPAKIDPQRMAQELAILAERLDVTEELVRLGAHLDEARRLLEGKGPSGRRLDFLAQEIHREINTIGSKAQAAEIASRVIDMKVELERFREQVQNVE